MILGCPRTTSTIWRKTPVTPLGSWPPVPRSSSHSADIVPPMLSPRLLRRHPHIGAPRCPCFPHAPPWIEHDSRKRLYTELRNQLLVGENRYIDVVAHQQIAQMP